MSEVYKRRVFQHGAADARRPQVGVERQRFRKLAFGDDNENGEPPARPQDPGHLAEDGGLVWHQVDDAVGDDDIGAFVVQGQVVDIAFQIGDVGEPGLVAQALGLFALRVGHVDADDFTFFAH